MILWFGRARERERERDRGGGGGGKSFCRPAGCLARSVREPFLLLQSSSDGWNRETVLGDDAGSCTEVLGSMVVMGDDGLGRMVRSSRRERGGGPAGRRAASSSRNGAGVVHAPVQRAGLLLRWHAGCGRLAWVTYVGVCPTGRGTPNGPEPSITRVAIPPSRVRMSSSTVRTGTGTLSRPPFVSPSLHSQTRHR